MTHALPTTVQLDVNSETEINRHTHTDAEALPLVVADTRQWLDSLDLPDVTFEVKQVFGPGGGASVIEFTAPTYDKLRKLVVDYDGGENAVGGLGVDYLLGLAWD